MGTPILATKLYMPRLRESTIPRSRLLARLNEGRQRKLSLVSAPAGFGKTTLIRSWLEEDSRSAAWLSLDAAESDSARFLAYLIAALQSITPMFGREVLDWLDAPQLPAMDVLLTALLNELAGLSQDVVLVLDDYHVVDAPAVDELVTFLLDHCPPQLHLVITTREDPPLPLARLRARGEMTELRAAELRFTRDEAMLFLRQLTGVDLTADQVDALEQRTEGWVAGLQLAALSLQGREDFSTFIRTFAGDNRYILDYLVEEVLAQLTAEQRAFLLQTSVLERLCGPLCDAVTGGAEGSEVLESLERSNLFLISLDDRRRWYRYHHLFGDVLRAQLQAEQPDLVATLHRRAGQWFTANEQPADAIVHFLAADDLTHVAQLLEQCWPAMEENRQAGIWYGWARALPDTLIHERPVLGVAYAWAALDRGDLEDAAARLAEADARLARINADPTGDLNGDAQLATAEQHAAYRALPASIAMAQTYLAQARADIPGTVHHARRALDLLPADQHARRGVPASLLALAEWRDGHLPAAARSLAAAMADFEQAGKPMFSITGAYALADLLRTLGRLTDAFGAFHHALQLTAGRKIAALWGTADCHTGLCELHCERNDPDAAAESLQRSRDLGEQAKLPRWRHRWALAGARLRELQGDPAAALAMLDVAEADYVRGPVPDTRPVAARKARIHIAQGRLDRAARWAKAAHVSIDEPPTFLREYELITLARLLLARAGDSLLPAVTLLNRLLHDAVDGERNGSVIEILVLLAYAHHAAGDHPAALSALERALSMAEPEGYMRIFLDEGPSVMELVLQLSGRPHLADYTSTLLAAAGRRNAPGQDRTAPSASPAQSLAEPLSERELEVLDLIAQGLSNREISDRLVVALSTVKGHNRNIFGKLQVRRRTEAVARARELGLI